MEVQLLAVQILVLFRKREPGLRIADQCHGLPFFRHGVRAFHAFRHALPRQFDAVVHRVVFTERKLMNQQIAGPRVGGLPYADKLLLLAARTRQHGHDQENDIAPSFHKTKVGNFVGMAKNGRITQIALHNLRNAIYVT